MLSTRDPTQNKIATQTNSERMEKNIQSKQTWKKSLGINIISDKIDFKTKGIKKETEKDTTKYLKE